MSVPPVPPRPYSAQSRSQSNPPPVPPVPQELRYDSPPHFADPIAAPRPHRVDPSIPANVSSCSLIVSHLMSLKMAYNLEEYSGVNYSPGFTVPQPAHGHAPLPPPPGTEWSPFAGSSFVNPGIQNQSFSSPVQQPAVLFDPNQTLAYNFSSPEPIQQPIQQSPPQPTAPSLTVPMPTVATLQSIVPAIQNPNYDHALKVAWARDVLTLVDRTVNTSTSTDPPVGPVIIHDPALLRLAQLAVPTVLQIAASSTQPIPPHVAEAIYLRATLAASGAYPEHVQKNLRVAFRDFETAARAGYAAAWFRIGRDYENVNDATRARDCFERGVKLGVESCAYVSDQFYRDFNDGADISLADGNGTFNGTTRLAAKPISRASTSSPCGYVSQCDDTPTCLHIRAATSGRVCFSPGADSRLSLCSIHSSGIYSNFGGPEAP